MQIYFISVYLQTFQAVTMYGVDTIKIIPLFKMCSSGIRNQNVLK